MGTPLFKVTGPPGTTLSTVLCLVPGPSPANKLKGVIFQRGPPVLHSACGHLVQYVKLSGPIVHRALKLSGRPGGQDLDTPVSQPAPRSALGHPGGRGDTGPLSVEKQTCRPPPEVFGAPPWPGHFCRVVVGFLLQRSFNANSPVPLCHFQGAGPISPRVTRSPCWRPSNKAHSWHPVLLPETA